MINSGEIVAINFFKKLDRQINTKLISLSFGCHPYSLSATAISDVLKEWGVDSYTIQLNTDNKDEVFNLPMPFITFTNENKGEFVLVRKIDENHISYYSAFDKNVTNRATKDFMIDWRGIQIIPFVGEHAGDINYKETRRKELTNTSVCVLSTIFLAAAVCWILYCNALISPFYIALFILKLAGLAIGVILLQNEYGINHSLVNEYCTDEKNDCNALLKSPAAKIFDAVSWSELGFIYFLGSFLYLFYTHFSGGSIFALFLLNVPTCIFSFYSLWHQKMVAKQWCKFCLATLAIFWTEFMVLSLQSKVFVWTDAIMLGGSLSLVSLVWFTVRPILEKYNFYWKSFATSSKIKYQRNIFQDRLQNQTKYDESPQSFRLEREEETDYILTVISNPTCAACAKEFKTLERYIYGAYENLSINFVFSTPPISDDGYHVVNTILYINEQKGFYEAIKALKDWYKGIPINKWLIQYGKVETEHPSIQLHRQWLQQSGIRKSPVLLLNHHEIPEEYNLSEIKYVI